MTFLLFVGFIWVLIWCSKLNGRTEELERRSQNAPQKSPAAAPVPAKPEVTPTAPLTPLDVAALAVAPQPRSMPQVAQVPASPRPAPVSQTPAEPSRLVAWFAENTLIKIGAFLFFLGAVWFVSYAISEGWISPLTRIFLGIALGVLVAALGQWRKRVSSEHFLVLTTLGVGIVVASIYAGQFLFKLFPSTVALILLILAIGYAVMVSVTTKTQWLGVLSAITALLAPLLVNAPEPNPQSFLTYLFAVSVAFLAVVFWTHWRSITFTLVIGTTLFLFSIYGGSDITHTTLWVFVLMFSALFYGASTVSMLRSAVPSGKDIASLTIVSGSLVYWIHVLTKREGLITFIFAFIVAVTGYVCHLRQVSEKIVAVYAALGSVLWLIATSLAFDGFTMTMVYTVEIALALVVTLHLRLRDVVVRIAVWAFLIPVCVSFKDMLAPEWSTSAWHPSAMALYILTATALGVSYFSFTWWRIYANSLYRGVGVIFLDIFWLYAHICAALICGALFVGDTVSVMRYVSWTVISLGVVAYIVALRLPARMVYISMFGFLLPVLTSLSVLDMHPTSWHSISSCGLYFMTAVTVAISAWLIRRGVVQQEKGFLYSGGIALGVGWLYTVLSLSVFWGALVFDLDFVYILRYVSEALVSFALVGMVRVLRAPTSWTPFALITLIVPLSASLASLFTEEWRSSWMHPHALGLYILTLTIFYGALVVYRLGKGQQGKDQEILFVCAKTLFILFGLYAVALVWLVADALFVSPDTSVSVALLVYTLSGLSLYTVGRVRGAQGLRYAGITLLSGVVMRLLLVDVWNMAILGRIVTFLGVGLLFIVTALFEKPFGKLQKKEVGE